MNAPFRHRFRCRFPSNSIPRRRRPKNMYTVCQKKTQSRSDYLQAQSACYAPKAPVVGAEGAWCREKTQSRSDYCRREAPTTRRRRLLLAPKAPVMRRRRLGNVIGAAGALLRGLQWRRRRPTLRSGAASIYILAVHRYR